MGGGDGKVMGLLTRLLRSAVPAPSEEELAQETLRANALLQQAEQALGAAEAYEFLRQYRTLVAASAQKENYNVDDSNEILARHLLAAAEKRGVSYQELLVEQGDETLKQAVDREFKKFKERTNGFLTFKDEASIRWHAMQYSYDAACGYVIGGIHGSLEQQDPAIVASDNFHAWFTGRVEYLKELGSRMKVDDTALPEQLEPVHKAKQEIEERVRTVLEQEHDQHYDAFRSAMNIEDAIRSLVPLIGMSITYQRLLEVNPQNLLPDVTAKLKQFGAELAATREGMLAIKTENALYVTDLPPVTEWSAPQTNVQQLPHPRLQSKHPAEADPEQDDYAALAEGYTQKEASTPARKNGTHSRFERALGIIGSAAVITVLGLGALYFVRTRLNQPEPPTMERLVEQLSRIDVTPAQEAAYVHAFHHTAQEQAYLSMRRAGWCPTQEVLTKLALPFGEYKRSWDKMHARRAELLRTFAADPTYTCRR